MEQPLNDRELLFISYLLDQGGEAIFKRICEDMHPDAYDLFTDAEKDEMDRQYNEHNNSPEDHKPGYWSHQGSIQSIFMAHRIRSHLAAKLGLSPAGTWQEDDELAKRLKSQITAANV